MEESAWGREFLERFRTGDTEVLRKLYVVHAPGVARLARRFFGSRSQVADVDDLVQEVFLRAFAPSARNAFDGSRSYGPYVGTLARNILIDWSRKRGRESLVDEPETLLAAAERSGSASSNADLAEQLARCVSRLPLELRRIHELRYVEGKAQREVCEALGISRQELRTRELRLLADLRREITGRTQNVGARARSVTAIRVSARP